MQEWNTYLLLVFIGFVVGFINTVSGGGSLLTLPVLIFMGLDSSVANGTNRIAIFIQSVFSLWGFKSKGVLQPYISLGWRLSITATIGSILGAYIALDVKNELFNKILSVVILFVVGFMVFRPNQKTTAFADRITKKHVWYSTIAFFFIGLYGGFIQAGTGIFILLTLTTIHRMSLLHSNVLKIMVLLIYSFFALIVFGIYDKLNWEIGLVMALGQALGGWLAARWSVNKGDSVIKIFLIITVIAMAIKLWFF